MRRELIDRFGEKLVYEGGLSVRTSYVPVYQSMAEKAFRNGLIEYDRRHGWRGPVTHLPTVAAAQTALADHSRAGGDAELADRRGNRGGGQRRADRAERRIRWPHLTG